MKSEYEISKHRFYELKHFCLQYPEWLKLYSETDGYASESSKNEGDTTSKDGITRAQLYKNMRLVVNTCQKIGYEHWPDLLRYVIGASKMPYPGEEELFFHYYHKFFYVLSKKRA